MKMNGRKRMMKDYNNVLDFVERVSKKYFRRTNKMSLFDIVDQEEDGNKKMDRLLMNLAIFFNYEEKIEFLIASKGVRQAMVQ